MNELAFLSYEKFKIMKFQIHIKQIFTQTNIFLKLFQQTHKH